jgi:hypothetical protein
MRIYIIKIYNLNNGLVPPIKISSRFKSWLYLRLAYLVVDTYGRVTAAKSDQFDFEVVDSEGIHILGITEEEFIHDGFLLSTQH